MCILYDIYYIESLYLQLYRILIEFLYVIYDFTGSE